MMKAMLRKYNLIIVLGFALITSGCAKLAHLQELLALKAYSEEGSRNQQLVAAHNTKFDALVRAIESQDIKKYSTQKSIKKSFGQPIFVGQKQVGGQQQEMWMYRYATKYFNTSKVYLYFDTSDKLATWEYVPAPTSTKEDS
ncbi:MAG: hypothetical protein Q7S13_06470 [Candidatus Omnitrophota bacterium]|nr:hypothetical protein [Candidatus Omnitrophota bacterium]